MSFWDSSAIIPLVATQEMTSRADELYRSEKSGIIVWWGTYTECVSALSRLERMSELTSAEVEKALAAVREISKSWNVILPSNQVREKANRLLRVHPLRTGDAFQLASAIVASEDSTSSLALTTFDERLATAARKEGFPVIAVENPCQPPLSHF
jgi:predicted nucleic acid-binding protein